MYVTQTEVGERSVVITVDDELDLATAPELRAALEGIEADGYRTTIDLGDCAFVDSTGIGVIVDAGRRLKGTTKKLRIANLRGQPRQVFELTLTDQLPYLDISD
jgi:anti-sigma B factor antagonist